MNAGRKVGLLKTFKT